MNPSIAQRVLRLLHPKAEDERMEVRMAIARARAGAEELDKTIIGCIDIFTSKKANGDGRK